MLGSITASGQQDLSRLERTWGESSPRPVEYGALVLAHDALSGGFWCEVRLFGLGFGVRCAVFGVDLVCGAPFLGWILVRGMWCADFGAGFGTVRRFWARFWCAVRRFWARFRCAVCGAPTLEPISVHGVPFWGRFWCVARRFWLDFGARCVVRRFWGGFRCTVRLFGFDFGALPFWDRFWCVVRWCWGRSQPAATRSIQIGEDLGGIEPETCRIWGLGSGAWCPFGWILVRGAPFRVGFWCAVRRFWGGFGVWCAVFGLDFGARYVVRRFSGRFRCTVHLFGLARLERAWGESSPRPVEYGALVLAHDALSGGFWCEVRLFGLGFGVRCAVWCAVFGLDFGARYVVRRFWGRFRCTVRRFWARFWRAVRRFLGWILVRGVWCADFGADFGARWVFLGSILARGAPFLGWILVRGVWSILGPISVHGGSFWGRFWCVARRFWARFWCTVCGAPILGRISLHGAPFWVRFWCVAFLGSILVHGALMLGSITASGHKIYQNMNILLFGALLGTS